MTNVVTVMNISKVINEENIRELFSTVGTITHIEWYSGENENSCHIAFENVESSRTATLLTNTVLGERCLQVFEAAPMPYSTGYFHSNHNDSSSTTQVQASKRVLTPAETIAQLKTAARKLNPFEAIYETDQLEEQRLIARTVYVGNIAPHVTEGELRSFLLPCGNIIYVKMAGNPAMGVKYAFVEFDSEEAAQKAMAMTGTGANLADRPIKVGPAMNPIVKPPSVAVNSDPTRIESALSLVELAKRRLERKKMKTSVSPRARSSRRAERSCSRYSRKSRKSSPHGKSRSRRSRSISHRGRKSRSRSHRSRTSNSKSHRSRKSRSRSLSQKRSKTRSEKTHKRKKSTSSERYEVHIPRNRPRSYRPQRYVSQVNEGLVWDGFQWTNPSGMTIRQKSENLATKILDVVTTDQTKINPSAHQAMVQQAHQQAALLQAHMNKLRK